MPMRMQELSERSGLPRTTIHHYLRESLLPTARKSAPNAAEYDEAHLERLALITRLRQPGRETGSGLSIPDVRAVLRYVQAGVGPGAAVRLVRAGAGTEDEKPPSVPTGAAAGGWGSLEDLSAAAEIDPTLTARLGAAGLLAGDEPVYTAADLLVLQAAAVVCDEYEVEAADLAPFADLIRDLGNYAATLGDLQAARAREGAGADEARRPLADALRRLSEALLWRALEDS